MNKKDKEDWNLTLKDVKELYSILFSDSVLNQSNQLYGPKSNQLYGPNYHFNEKEIEIIKLHWHESKSFNKIATELGLSETYVRQKHQKIIRMMKINILRSISRLEELSNTKKELEEVKRENERLLNRFKDLSKDEKNLFGNPEYYKLSIYDFDLSVRTLNCLKAEDIETVQDLLNYKKSDFFRLRNFGKKSFNEVEDKILNPLNLKLKE